MDRHHVMLNTPLNLIPLESSFLVCNRPALTNDDRMDDYKDPKTRKEKKGDRRQATPYSSKHVRLAAAVAENSKHKEPKTKAVKTK